MNRQIRISTKSIMLSIIVMMFATSIMTAPAASASAAETAPSKTNVEIKRFSFFQSFQINLDQLKQWFTIQPSKPAESPAPNVPKTPVEKPNPAPSNEGSQQSWELQVVQLVNVERAKVGLPALQYDAELSKVAAAKSSDMRDRNYFSHDSPTYGSPFDMMRQFGISYRTAGENIAAGQRTPSEVMEAWMNSPGHRQNILSNQYTHIGVGIAHGGSYGIYWTQMFIGK